MHTVIYIFRSPSGRSYVGRRAVTARALRTWPRCGTGSLPDGYTGSGKVWGAIHRRHGPACQWRILARVTGTRAEADAVERRAVRLARAVFGGNCVNIRGGGDGWNSREAREIVAGREADPGAASRNRASLALVRADWNASPEGRAHIHQLAARWSRSPGGLAAVARARLAASSPEARARAEATKRFNAGWRALAAIHPEWWPDSPPGNAG